MPRLRWSKVRGAREFALEGLGTPPDKSSILLGRDERISRFISPILA